jgi:predicted signal transduction protein with EAL and GGDEF domain
MTPAAGSGDSSRDRRFNRERLARLQAEAIAEQGLRDLFQRQQEIQLLVTIAEAANSARTVAEAMQSALDAICEYTKWPVGHHCSVVTDPLEDERRIVSTDTWHIRADVEHEAAARTEAARLADELCLGSQVLKTGAPVWIDDIANTSPAAAAAGFQYPGEEKPHAAFGLPVLAGHEVAAVLEFLAPVSTAPDRARLELFTHIGVQLGRVIERERAQAQSVDAFHDALTHLPNRALFLRYVQRALKRRHRYEGYRFAVLFVDLDGFKAVNDSLGHRAGDEMLVKIGARLSRIIRATDSIGRVEQRGSPGTAESTVARLGGDEFTLLLEDIVADSDALQVAERIHAALAEPLVLERGAEIFASASIGIACSRPGHRTAVDVLQDADIAMYRAKAAGKRRSAMFDQQLHEQAITRLQLENDLRRAVERKELCLAYQPIVRLDTGAVLGFEALLRWRHPLRGLLDPTEFLAIAESGGTIVEIGAWALAEACRQLRTWQERYGLPALTMAVNISPKQFMQKDLATLVADTLAATGISAGRLSLEVTESVAMSAPAQSLQQLAALDALGVDLALDDFGAGHSSHSYLGRFKFHCLKVDRSFVRQIDENYGITLVRTIVSLGSSLGLRVIAEGVETAREVDRLRHLGCLYGQGYHFSRPVMADEIEASAFLS